MPWARLPRRTPPPTVATPEVASTEMFCMPCRSTTMLPSLPPELKDAYEWPPLLAWTLTPAWPAHTTASDTCCAVVGSTIAAGVYTSRRLYGSASWLKLGDNAKLTGTFFVPRQSASVVFRLDSSAVGEAAARPASSRSEGVIIMRAAGIECAGRILSSGLRACCGGEERGGRVAEPGPGAAPAPSPHKQTTTARGCQTRRGDSVAFQSLSSKLGLMARWPYGFTLEMP